MMKTLTPGRWLGLKTTSGANNKFSIVALDQRGAYRAMLPPNTPYSTAVAIKCEITQAVAPPATAMLLDPDYGIKPIMEMSREVGLLMPLEAIGWKGSDTAREIFLNPDWTVEKAKRFGANGVKLLVYYHPDSGKLASKTEELMQEICEECHAYDIPIFVEPMSYSLNANIDKSSVAFAKRRPEIVIETARRFSQLGCDILKMEFPMDADFDTDELAWRDACRALSDAVDVPWVLLSAGVDYDTFGPQVRIACEQGASGFLGGRAIWKEVTYQDEPERKMFLETVVRTRIQELCGYTEIARPWTDFYEPTIADMEWPKSYIPVTA